MVISWLRRVVRSLRLRVSASPKGRKAVRTASANWAMAPASNASVLEVGDQDSFRQRRVAGPVSPSLSGMARAGPSRSIGPLPGGSKFFRVIPGFKFLAPCIQIRYRSNFAVPVPQMNNVLLPRNCACAMVPPASSQRPWSTSRRFTPIRRWAGGLIRMIPAFGLRSSVVPEFPADPLRGQWPVPGPASHAGYATGERWPSQDGPSVKPAPLLTHCLLTRPIPASACGHDQVPQVDRCGQFSVILASTPGTPALVPAPGSRSRSPRQGRDFLWRNNTAITLARSRHPC